MPVRTLRAALTAVFLGTAAAGAAALVLAAPAQALTVSAKVGPLLNEAKALYAAGKYDAALAKLKEAEAVKSTPDDTAVINSMKQAIGVKTGDVALGGAAAAKAKFANDYNAGKFKDVIADAEILKKNGALDAQSQLIVGQAYYKAGDYAGCVRYAKTLSGNETALQLQARCAYETGDDATQRAALEQLVARILERSAQAG
jgi:tetratricopeptide (TPR) repeat protein